MMLSVSSRRPWSRQALVPGYLGRPAPLPRQLGAPAAPAATPRARHAPPPGPGSLLQDNVPPPVNLQDHQSGDALQPAQQRRQPRRRLTREADAEGGREDASRQPERQHNSARWTKPAQEGVSESGRQQRRPRPSDEGDQQRQPSRRSNSAGGAWQPNTSSTNDSGATRPRSSNDGHYIQKNGGGQWGSRGGADGDTRAASAHGQQPKRSKRPQQPDKWDECVAATMAASSMSELKLVADSLPAEERVSHAVGMQRALHVSAIINRMPKLAGPDDGPLVAEISKKLVPLLLALLPYARTRSLCNALWALSKLDQLERPTLEALMDALLLPGRAVRASGARISSATIQEVSNTCWALAKAEYSDPARWGPLVDTVVAYRGDDFDSQKCGNLAWSVGKVGPPNAAAVLHKVTTRAKEIFGSLRPQEVSNLLWGMARLKYEDRDIFNAAADRLIADLPAFKPQEICQSLWALTTMHHPVEPLHRVVVRSADRLPLNSLKPQEISNLLWSFARAVEPLPSKEIHPLLARLTVRLHALAQTCDHVEFSPLNVTHCVWALAKLGWSDSTDVYQYGLTRFLNDPHAFNELEQGMLLYGLTRIPGAIGEGQLQLLVQRQRTALDNCGLNQLIVIATTYGTNEFYDLALWTQLAQVISARLNGMSEEERSASLAAELAAGRQLETSSVAHGLTMVVSLLGNVNSAANIASTPYLLAASADYLLPRVPLLAAPTITGALAAFSKLGFYSQAFCTAACQRLLGLVDDMKPSELAGGLHALSAARHYDPQLTAAVAATIRRRVTECEPRICISVLYSLTTLNHYDAGAFGAIMAHLADQPAGSLPTLSISLVLWSQAVSGHHDAAFIRRLFAMLDKQDPSEMPDSLYMLYHTHTVLQLEGLVGGSGPAVTNPSAPVVMSPALLAACRDAFRIEPDSNPNYVSAMQREVYEVLIRMGEKPQLEYGCLGKSDRLLTVDVALLSYRGVRCRIAIEVDGPDHFMANNERHPDGQTVARNRSLYAMRWRVVAIHYQDWARLRPGTAGFLQRAAAYLTARFRQVLAAPRRRSGGSGAGGGTSLSSSSSPSPSLSLRASSELIGGPDGSYSQMSAVESEGGAYGNSSLASIHDGDVDDTAVAVSDMDVGAAASFAAAEGDSLDEGDDIISGSAGSTDRYGRNSDDDFGTDDGDSDNFDDSRLPGAVPAALGEDDSSLRRWRRY